MNYRRSREASSIFLGTRRLRQWLIGTIAIGAFVAVQVFAFVQRSQTALRARIPPEADENQEWHPLLRKGRPPSPLKLPASFEALTSLSIYTAPRLDADLIPGRVVQKGTHFSVEEVVFQGKLRGQDVIFLKPKRVYYKASRNMPDDGEDYGQGGWLCDLGTEKGPWFCRKLVKRLRV
ncbi:unnamed protein product [Cladocopium goreaui]|uniref:Transmembrane 9 superfamily member n=1 Tax=Cladocopium goreaui TaxID=2562237 RepID=A0A9P1C478_9DINO|nr:unnamed protein product [Cladocopium goreaui]